MAPPKKEAGSLSRPLPSDLASISGSPPAIKSGKESSPAKKSGSSAIKSNSAKVSPDKVAKTPDKSKKPFRFRWMKKLKPSNGSTSEQDENTADAIEESKGSTVKARTNGTPTKKVRGSASSTKFESLMDFNAAVGATKLARSVPKTARKVLFGTKPTSKGNNDTVMKDIGNGDDDESEDDDGEEKEGLYMTPLYAAQADWTPPADEHGLIGPDHPSVPKSLNNMEKARKKAQGPQDKNGRVHGRELVHWHRKKSPIRLGERRHDRIFIESSHEALVCQS